MAKTVPLRRRDFAAFVRRVGAADAARRVGRSESTIRRWLREGVPKAARPRALAALTTEREARRGRAEAVKRARERLKYLEAKAIKKGDISPARSRPLSRRMGVRTKGYDQTFRVGRFLTDVPWEYGPGRVLDLLDRFKPPKRFRYWLATLAMSEYMMGDGGDVQGYTTVRAYMRAKDINFFVTESILSTGRQDSRSAVMAEMESLLEDAVEADSTLYARSVFIATFDYLTDEQRRSRETERRARESRNRPKKETAKVRGRKRKPSGAVSQDEKVQRKRSGRSAGRTSKRGKGSGRKR